MNPTRLMIFLTIAIVLTIAVAGAITLLKPSPATNTETPPPPPTTEPPPPAPAPAPNPGTGFVRSNVIPEFTRKPILTGLDHPWDMAMLEDGSFIFTERNNKINYYKDGKVSLLLRPADTYVQGEGGMLGLALDPEFETNKYIYVCFNSSAGGAPDVRVVRFEFDAAEKKLSARKNLITAIPSHVSGRHSGCQLEFGPDGYLWVSTGDAAMTENPQSRTSLAGKILRVDRDGKAAPGNMGGNFDKRIFNFGHRNPQGLGFFKPGLGFAAPGINIEQGSYQDDEVNKLVKGNFGWDPKSSYNENGVPMTDRAKFPNAIKALWRSGRPTQATSGGTIIQGTQWKAWDQAVAVAVQKNQRVIILELNFDLTIRRRHDILKGELGRIRTVVMGTDGNLYLLTDNGSNSDRIVRLSPN